MILDAMKRRKISVSRWTVFKVIKEIKSGRSDSKTENPSKRTNKRKVLTPKVLSTIKKYCIKEIPLSQTEIGRRLGTSQQNISRAIRELGGKIVKKGKVHKLLQCHKDTRKTNCRKLYEKHLAGKKSVCRHP